MALAHRHRRLVEGMLLGACAPVGWSVLCSVHNLWPMATREYAIWLFSYMALGTVAAFGVFSYLIGCNEERFALQSIRDPLTKLYNRRLFQERFEQEFSLAMRQETPLTLVLADLDHFKQVNDIYGHPAGDAVLRQVAIRMQRLVRQGEVAARIGGEEFAILLPGSDSEQGRVLAERLRAAIRSQPMSLPGGAMLPCKVTLGVAGLDVVAATSPEALLSAADAALYTGKCQGRDRVVVQTSGWRSAGTACDLSATWE
ncbi:GGDEF domain-containing protein [Megalodesulfovibrio gigas]|nr:GGDEF domain-containing protein [Megalodesulfovibrio gigas]